MNEVNSRALARKTLGFGAGNNEDMLILGRILNVADFFMNVAFYTTAQRRIKLGEIAKLHRIADCRLAIADLRDAAMIETISSASRSSGLSLVIGNKPVSIISSSQNALSSASSSTVPSFAITSRFDRLDRRRDSLPPPMFRYG